MQQNQLTLGCIPFGVVYLILPEQDAATRRRDLTNIKSLGFNTVVFWPPVSRWEATPPGGLSFHAIDEVMDLCAELGLKAILELQGQDLNHEALPETLDFMRTTRGEHAEDVAPINHPEVRKQICAYLQAVAKHFNNHPALLAYDIFNEVHYTSIDEWTIKEFVGFLKNQYHDIQSLNRAWVTFFPDFDTVEDWVTRARPRTWSSGVAGRDWFRFRPRNFAVRLREWAAAIREVHPEAVILADILGCDTMHNRNGHYGGATDWLTTEAVDVYGLSCWADMFNPSWWLKDCYAWPHLWRQQLAAGKGKQVIISELMTPNRTMFPEEHSSMTDQIRLWGYQALFNGIKGIIYWKYRPFARGVQVAGRGLTDYKGNPNEFAQQASTVAAFLARHAETIADATPDDAGCALLFDQNTQDLYQAIQSWDEEFYTDAFKGFFRGLWQNGVSPSFLTPQDLLDGVPERIKVIVVPCNVSISQSTARALITFVSRGGQLMTEGRFGLLDEDGNLNAQVPGVGISEVFGVSERKLLSDAADTIPFQCGAMELPDYLQELTLGADTKVLLRTASGAPAMVSSQYGAGQYLHLAFLLGRKLERRVPLADEVFNYAFAQVSANLKPAVPIFTKGNRVDISVLVDAERKPVLIGVVNYHDDLQHVRLEWDRAPRLVEADEGCTVAIRGPETEVALSPRSLVALLF